MGQSNFPDEVVTELIQKGYTRAASSFSAMIAHQVSIDSNNIDLNESPDPDILVRSFTNRANQVLIRTKIIGDLKGESYLLLTDEEVNVISDLSRAAFGGASMGNDVIINELDNILSAAVITELSNVLKLRMYGDVPELFYLKDVGHLQEILESNNDDNCYIMTNATFVFEHHVSVSPIFLWRFENRIVSLLEKVYQSAHDY